MNIKVISSFCLLVLFMTSSFAGTELTNGVNWRNFQILARDIDSKFNGSDDQEFFKYADRCIRDGKSLNNPYVLQKIRQGLRGTPAGVDALLKGIKKQIEVGISHCNELKRQKISSGVRDPKIQTICQGKVQIDENTADIQRVLQYTTGQCINAAQNDPEQSFKQLIIKSCECRNSDKEGVEARLKNVAKLDGLKQYFKLQKFIGAMFDRKEGLPSYFERLEGSECSQQVYSSIAKNFISKPEDITTPFGFGRDDGPKINKLIDEELIPLISARNGELAIKLGDLLKPSRGTCEEKPIDTVPVACTKLISDFESEFDKLSDDEVDDKTKQDRLDILASKLSDKKRSGLEFINLMVLNPVFKNLVGENVSSDQLVDFMCVKYGLTSISSTSSISQKLADSSEEISSRQARKESIRSSLSQVEQFLEKNPQEREKFNKLTNTNNDHESDTNNPKPVETVIDSQSKLGTEADLKQESLEKNNSSIANIPQQLSNITSQITTNNAAIADKTQEIKDLKEELKKEGKSKQEIARDADIANLKKQIEDLKKQNNDLTVQQQELVEASKKSQQVPSQATQTMAPVAAKVVPQESSGSTAHVAPIAQVQNLNTNSGGQLQPGQSSQLAQPATQSLLDTRNKTAEAREAATSAANAERVERAQALAKGQEASLNGVGKKSDGSSIVLTATGKQYIAPEQLGRGIVFNDASIFSDDKKLKNEFQTDGTRTVYVKDASTGLFQEYEITIKDGKVSRKKLRDVEVKEDGLADEAEVVPLDMSLDKPVPSSVAPASIPLSKEKEDAARVRTLNGIIDGIK